MGLKTPLYACHVAAGARIVDFAGWEMPLHYGSQLREHIAVRNDAGVFDVSHMAVIDFSGEDAQILLRKLLANDVARLRPGRGLYSCLLNEQGGILDDLIVYQVNEKFYRVVVNAGTRQKDLAWFRDRAAGYRVEIAERTDLAMLAIQGPQVQQKISAIFPPEIREALITLKPFAVAVGGGWFVARTGYTGEDGFEVILPAAEAQDFWEKLLAAGVSPCGLGARDTLRLEAGLNLYGADMDETVTPLAVNLGWTVAFDPAGREFVGRRALERQQHAGITQQLVGLVAQGRTILRAHQSVHFNGSGITGEITSGSFSPTLEAGIAFARVPCNAGRSGETCHVMVREKSVPVQIIKPPFVKKGKKNF